MSYLYTYLDIFDEQYFTQISAVQHFLIKKRILFLSKYRRTLVFFWEHYTVKRILTGIIYCKSLRVLIAQSAGAVEYSDCTSAEE